MKNDGKNLNSVLLEQRRFLPDPQFVAQAQLKADELQRLRKQPPPTPQASGANRPVAS